MTDHAHRLPDAEVNQWLNARNQQLEHDTRLFAARHKTTRLYSLRVLRFLRGCADWMAAKKPSVLDVQAELQLAEAHAPRWTADLQQAECWDRHAIAQYRQYLPDVEFLPLELTLTPLS